MSRNYLIFLNKKLVPFYKPTCIFYAFKKFLNIAIHFHKFFVGWHGVTSLIYNGAFRERYGRKSIEHSRIGLSVKFLFK